MELARPTRVKKSACWTGPVTKAPPAIASSARPVSLRPRLRPEGSTAASPRASVGRMRVARRAEIRTAASAVSVVTRTAPRNGSGPRTRGRSGGTMPY